MLNLKLSKATQDNVSICVGKSFSDISALSPDEEKKFIGNNVKFSELHNSRKTGRGNLLLSRRKFRTLEEVEKKT